MLFPGSGVGVCTRRNSLGGTPDLKALNNQPEIAIDLACKRNRLRDLVQAGIDTMNWTAWIKQARAALRETQP
jgi:hypothetical protein